MVGSFSAKPKTITNCQNALVFWPTSFRATLSRSFERQLDWHLSDRRGSRREALGEPRRGALILRAVFIFDSAFEKKVIHRADTLKIFYS